MFTIFGMLSLLLGLLLLAISSWGLVVKGGFNGIVANILAGAMISYATVILLAQILSELGQIHRAGFLIGQAIIVLLVLLWNLVPVPGLPSLRSPVSTGNRFSLSAAYHQAVDRLKLILQKLKQLFSADPVLLVLGLGVAVSMLLGVYLILAVPPNTYDSLSYHLTRVAYWLHSGAMHHFNTPDPIKVVHQGYNFEIGLLWLTALWGNDRLAGFLQWGATILTTVAIYGLARRLRFGPPASLFAALVWNTFTIVVLQATSTKNDILVAFFVITAFYFLLAGLRDAERPFNADLIVFGLALGLALGTKSMVVLILPGLGLGCGWLLLSNPARFLPRLFYGAIWAVAGFAFFGFYNYAQNLLNYGVIFGSPELFNDVQMVQNPSPATFITNLARIVFHFFDPGGLPTPLVEWTQQWRPALAEQIFAWLHIAPNLPQANMDTFQFEGLRPITPREDAAWYGPLGFLLFWPVVLFYLIVYPFFKKDFWKWFTVFIGVGYLFGFALLVRWQLHMGRLFLVPVTLGAPLMAGFYVWTGRYKALRWLAPVIGLVVMGWSGAHNLHKSLVGPENIWTMDYYQLRTIQKPELALAHRYLDATMAEEARLGLVGNDIFVRWDYLFFGPNLKREVIYLGPGLDHIDLDTFNGHQLDYLVVAAYPPPTFTSEAPAWPVVQAEGMDWFLIKRSEMELFAQPPLQPVSYRQAFGQDYAAYQEILTALEQEPRPVRVLTTDPRMPYYDRDSRFVFGLTRDFEMLAGFTHLVVAPWWTAEDYERLGIPIEEVQSFLNEGKFVKEIAHSHGYVLYRLLF